MQKSVAFLSTTNDYTEKEIRKTIPSMIALEKVKCLAMNLTKEVKDIYNKKKEIEEDTRKTSHVHGLVNQHCENGYITKSNLYILYNPH
jgi:hypothetical protein